MHTPDSIEARIYEHVLGSGSPHPALLDTGVLPDEWTETYLRLLKEVAQKYDGQKPLPREVVSAVHFASWYLNIRYDGWKGLHRGQRDEKTESNLGRLRAPSEFLLLSGHVERVRARA